VTRANVHVFTARIPLEDYERLRLYAFTARLSINDVVLTAVRTLLEHERVEVPRDGTELGDVILDALRSYPHDAR
jgi:NRPS condensation-like uncharacterized protein